MSRVLGKYKFVLENYHHLPKEIQCLLTDQNISNDLLKCVCEMSYNILKKNVSVSNSQKRRLSKYKNVLKILSDKKSKVSKKRRMLKQVGRGFLPVLFSIIAPIVQSLLS